MIDRRLATLLLGSAAAVLPAAGAAAQDVTASIAAQAVPDLSQLSIEELAQLPVRSASKREEPLSAAPTALFVITGADIAGSSATSLPEVLRLAPNLQVQQVSGHEYAITARGFNGIESANKLLVLMDGRTIYSTLHSGVFWDLHAPLIEDIQQIEVISGPGGTLHGPNAVNGVISIVSRDARETIGGLVRGTAGPDELTLGARYGAPIGANGAIRFYANWFDRDNLPRSGIGPLVDDSFSGWQAGFRSDFGVGDDQLTLQGDIFDNDVDTLPGDGNRGHNLLARWSHELGGASALRVQAYYDYFERRFLRAFDSLETFDLDTQLNTSLGDHDIVIGGGVRTTRDEFINDANIFGLDPTSRRLWIWNAFVQDRFALTPRLSLIAGVKLERSSFSGVEILPNLRIAWQLDADHLLWAAVSRAVRTPSRIDRDLSGPPFLVRATDFRSEKLIAFEAGYRGQPSSTTSISVSVFFNLYDDIRTAELVAIPFPGRLSNDLRGHSYGVEAWGSWQALPWWRLSAGMSLLGKHFGLRPGATDISGAAALGDDPDYQLLLRSTMALRSNLSLDVGLRAVDGLETPATDGYVEADARLGWAVSDRIELFLAARNLLHRDHAESNDDNRAQLAERGAYAGARLRF